MRIEAVMIIHFKIFNDYVRFHPFNPIRLDIEENKSPEVGFAENQSLEIAIAVKSVS